jgi:hypothetical protein
MKHTIHTLLAGAMLLEMAWFADLYVESHRL